MANFRTPFHKYLPILNWLPAYKRAWFTADLNAGITVGIMLIPQGMAYAMIAGLPPVYGLYAALIPQVIYALTGTSRKLGYGPVAMDSLLVAAGLGALQLSGIEEYIGMAIFLALFMGIIQITLGLLRLGLLVRFLSKPVISGFTSAAALIIGFSQLKHLLGTEISTSNQFHQMIYNAGMKLGETHLPTLGLGLFAIVLIVALKQINKKIPGALIAVILSILASSLLNFETNGVPLVGQIPNGLPAFGLPKVPWDRLGELFSIALTLALIAFMEAISVAQAIEEKDKTEELRPNQELIALGLSNVVGSFFQSYPTTGGFSRTAVNQEIGARSGLNLIISALVIALTLLFLTDLFYQLPNAILAAIIMVAVSGLIDLRYPKILYKKRKDEFALLIITFLLTLFIGIKEGILLGVLFSLLLLVHRTSRPHIAVLGKIKGSPYFRNLKRFEKEAETTPGLLIFRFDGQLYFGNRDYFKKQLARLIEINPTPVHTVILNAESMNYIDSSAVYTLRQVLDDFDQRKITLLIAGAIGPTRDILHKSGLIRQLGKECVFSSTLDAYEYALNKKTPSALQQRISLQSKEP